MTPRAIHVMPNEGKSLIELLEREAKATQQPEGLYARLAADLRDQWGIRAETNGSAEASGQEQSSERARYGERIRLGNGLIDLVVIRL